VHMEMSELVINEGVIYKKLTELNLNKSPGPDNLHPRILYELRAEICKPLNILFNLSLKTGKIPADWRSAVITALHNKKLSYCRETVRREGMPRIAEMDVEMTT